MKNEVLESAEISQSSRNKKNKSDFLNKSIIIKIILFILSLALSFFTQNYFYKPNLGTIINSDMDSSGNIYILSIVERTGKYKITKISENGKIIFEKKLDTPTDNKLYKYKHLEVDSKGNFFLVQEAISLDAIVSNPSQYPIANESVKMYTEKGNYLKQVALFDLAANSIYMNQNEEYLKKIQIVNQKLSMICFNENKVKVFGVNPYLDESPSEEFNFEVNPPQSNDYSWINDFCVISNGSVAYTTKSGDFYLINQDGSNINNCRSLLPNEENSIASLSVDRLNNIYFIDLKTGSFYKFDTNTNSISLIYAIDDKIKIEDLTIKDFRKIRAINENDFFASSKTFVNPFFARFGNNNKLTSNISYKFFPYGLIFTVLGALFLFALILILNKARKIGIKRTHIAVKATLMFLPVFIALMASVVVYSTFKSMQNYNQVLEQNQTIGAKIVSEKINGNNLSYMIPNANYDSPEFNTMRNAVKSAYIDLKNKVGDNSDYIVVYTLDNNKIYSVMNNKYSGDSKYYNNLHFAEPDMTQEKIALVDSLLERDEIEEIYSVWSRLKDQQVENVMSNFRDVHGDLTVAFVPVKNDSGNVVGMVGNFLDKNSHVKAKMFDIFQELSVIIGITAILVFLYLCLIVWILLRPMRILNHGIEVMINGHWKNRLPITSKDEFANISIAFNNMSDKLEEYTDNLIDLNSEYLRYVPKDLLNNYVGKEKITQTAVGDGKSSNISIVYITFNIGTLEDSSNINHNLFSYLQNSYSKIFDIVENNSGIVQNFSSLGATLIFNEPRSAINADLQILESNLDIAIKSNMQISVGKGSAFVGIIGDDVRRGVSMASKEMLRLIKIDEGIRKLGIKFATTESVVQEIHKEFELSLRFVGKFKDITDLSWVKMYEIIDSSDNERREINIRTKSKFERAVQLYIDGNLEESRALFVDVLHTNRNDVTALYYINMCDLRSNINDKNLDIKNLVGGIF